MFSFINGTLLKQTLPWLPEGQGPTLFIFVKFLQKVVDSVSILVLFIPISVSPIRCGIVLCLAWQEFEVVKDKVSDF